MFVEMKMVNIILFCLGVIGITHIIVDSKLFEGIRNWFEKDFAEIASKNAYDWINSVIRCYQCCGFWVGLLCGPLLLNYGIVLSGFNNLGSDILCTWNQGLLIFVVTLAVNLVLVNLYILYNLLILLVAGGAASFLAYAFGWILSLVETLNMYFAGQAMGDVDDEQPKQ